MRVRRVSDAWLSALLCLLCMACEERHVQLATDTPDARTEVPDDASMPERCGDHACACDNAVDDDADGLSDGFDPECTGASDDDERTFATVPMGGPPMGACRDCFFDDDASSDNDGCAVHVGCINEGVAPMPPGSMCADCDVSRDCKDSCRPLTPNGCDCFGCCTIDIQGEPKLNVLLRETCSLGTRHDATACPRCIPNDACRNPCGRCELCPGRTEADLPMDCAMPMGPRHECDDREAVCDAETPCAEAFYCLQGCCLPVVE